MEQSNRQARLERRHANQRRNQLKGLGYIVIAAVIVTGILIYSNLASGPQFGDYREKNGTALGDPNAPVTLIEFADFQCPHCLNAYRGPEKQIIEEYVNSGQVQFVYRMVGFLGPESERSAEASYCAADQNMFWEYHDVVFASANFSNGNVGGYSDENLTEFAETAGLNVDEFSTCLLSGQNAELVSAAASEASTFGITGTPGYVINGSPLASGELPFAVIKEAIDAALAEAQ
jgi:protein-disulfide isomerase